MVLAGGTMSPMEEMSLQLFAPGFPVYALSVESPFASQNCLALILQKGPSGTNFRFTMENADRAELWSELGQTLSNVCSVAPEGIICFFASYRSLDRFLALVPPRTMNAIQSKKEIFSESSKTPSNQLLQDYQSACKKGALLLAVIGGRLSEGINFSDRLCRVLLVAGMPLPNPFDAETRVRAQHYASIVHDGKKDNSPHTLSHGDYYRPYFDSVCMRSVNQTIGRAIRHQNDYAAILLLDERYLQQQYRRLLSPWFRSGLARQESYEFGQCYASLVRFLRTKKNR